MTDQQDSQQWQPCPPGEVGNLVARLRRTRRQDRLQKAAAGLVCVAIVAVAGLYAIPRFGRSEPTYGGIACSEVQELAEQYMAGQLDEDRLGQIDVHLEACEHCQQFVARMMQDLPDDGQSAQRPSAGPSQVLLREDRPLSLAAHVNP